MATATKKKTEDKTPEESLDEQIAVFEPVAKSVTRKLEYDGLQREYVQKEMGFLTKLKFFRLLSQTIRLASQADAEGTKTFLAEFFDPQPGTDNTEVMIQGILQLVEVSPDFIEEAYCYALSIPTNEQAWAYEAFENLTDDEGLDIIDVFIAQNGEAMRDFFTKKIQKIGARVQTLLPEQPDQESQTTR